ncbi:MAG: DUF4154 domain-containing protein [Bacteroidia bacterium]|nr:DUF4154 domain-containing protein [Bacteroidia bacterium]
MIQPRNSNSRQQISILLGFCLWGILLPFLSFAQNDKDEKVLRMKKSILIFNFGQQIQWPPNSLGSEFRIGVLGENPLTEDLKALSAARTIKGRKVRVSSFRTLPISQKVDLLFVDRDYNFDIKQVLDMVTGTYTLVVGENYEFNQSMLNLVRVESNILYELNEKLLRKEGLLVNSVLLENAITSADRWQDLYAKSEQSLEMERQTVLEQKALLKEQDERLERQQQSLRGQTRQIQNQQATLDSQLVQLQLQLDKIEGQKLQIKTQEDRISSFNQEIGKIIAQKERQEQQLQEKIALLAGFEKQILAQRKDIEKQKEEVASRVNLIHSQNEEIMAQGKKIEEQREELGAQVHELHSKEQIVYLLIALIVLTVFMVVILIRGGRNRKLANVALTQKNNAIALQKEQLERANLELGQFAYVASHDLQEPLRTVANFVNVLQEDYGPQFDEQASQYFNLITDSTTRMKALVKDLLDYSRIGRERDFVNVDLNQLIKEIRTDLDSLIRENGAQIQTDDLPVIPGSATDLRLLFQNLLNNAIKFSRPGISPQIRISATPQGESWILAVKDNGIGIEEKFHEKIFIIFQRLHNKNEYQGTGIGLAHCKKIVDLHRGKIWVESIPEQGSTFFVSLPAKNLPNQESYVT